MEKNIIKFSKALIGKKLNFSVATKSQIENKKLNDDIVKVEELYLTRNGTFIAVVPDTYVAVDNNK